VEALVSPLAKRNVGYYLPGDGQDPETAQRLKELLTQIDKERGTLRNYCYYLAISPGLFAGVINQLGMAGLTHVVVPILRVWKALPPRNFPNYAVGTRGPKEADELIGRNGRR
jgi:glucose-6-phosphate 1-dehydrogenase